ncbi:GTP-binding protein Rho1 [Tulasnella sp. 332]|nr:GTP-binding protein Rho1 [Tulasnella sp. 332]
MDPSAAQSESPISDLYGLPTTSSPQTTEYYPRSRDTAPLCSPDTPPFPDFQLPAPIAKPSHHIVAPASEQLRSVEVEPLAPLLSNRKNHGTRRSGSSSSSAGPLKSKQGYETRKKLVVVGNAGTGKTPLVIVFLRGIFLEVWVPTIFENYVVDVEVDGVRVELALWDTPGGGDYDRLRSLSYPDSHVILITFSIDSPDSLDSVQEKWISEVMCFCAGLPIILIGCKKDLRHDPRTIEELQKTSQHPVTPEEGVAVAEKIGAKHYAECSARTGAGGKEEGQG